MEAGLIHRKYGEFYDAIIKLGEYPLGVSPKLSWLKVSNSQVQSSFRDIKQEKFNGTIIDYLCLVSTRYLILMAGGNPDKIFNKDMPTDLKNMLRLAMKNPDYLFVELDMEPDDEFFTKVAKIWFGLYYFELKKSKV